MAETKNTDQTAKAVKKVSFFDGVKAEFNKISWPSKKDLFRQSVAVVCVSVVLGVVIAVLDMMLQYGVSFLTM